MTFLPSVSSPNSWSESERRWMQRALELAAQGAGFVEPNPMVGCVIVYSDQVVGEGWHQRYGGPHAEVHALAAAGERARGATMYVTLEPCCHHGKTPPCADAIVAAGLKRVVVAESDPNPLVAGGGLKQLRNAQIDVDVGLLGDDAHRLNAPFHQLIGHGRPWVIAKWAMSLDGKIATRVGDSKWISSDESRRAVHQIRGRVDAIVVGRRTVELDDPLLTARPAGPRVPTRIVLDSGGTLRLDSQLLQTIDEAPVLLVAGAEIKEGTRQRLVDAGCDLFVTAGPTWSHRLHELVTELGRRRFSNVLIEGGSTTLGGFFDQDLIDEVHVFIASRVIGGDVAPSPVAGVGVQKVGDGIQFSGGRWETVDGDLHYTARRKRSSSLTS